MATSRADYFFGELEGHPIGTSYAGRREAMYAGLHDNWVPGISGNPEVGANCIALNRGYVDDEDHGDWILYTGAGGNDPATKRQVADQDLNHRHNAALVYSQENGLPVRVLRGHRGEKPHAPRAGYRYDGLFKVTRHWSEQGRDGFRIWRFQLVRLTADEASPWTPTGHNGFRHSGRDDSVEASKVASLDAINDSGISPADHVRPARVEGIVQRIVRSNRISNRVKDMHEHRCQVCGIDLDLPVGRYSEGAHIRGLGAPHNGPDTMNNMLCLCPNHHVLFDMGAIYVDAEDLLVRDHRGNPLGRLRTVPAHRIDPAHLAHHRIYNGFGVVS